MNWHTSQQPLILQRFAIFACIVVGNDTEAVVLMDEFRQEAEAVGQCLHLNHMTSSDALLKPRRVNSRADYGWVKMGTPDDGYTYPEAPYEQVMAHCMSQ